MLDDAINNYIVYSIIILFLILSTSNKIVITRNLNRLGGIMK